MKIIINPSKITFQTNNSSSKTIWYHKPKKICRNTCTAQNSKLSNCSRAHIGIKKTKQIFAPISMYNNYYMRHNYSMAYNININNTVIWPPVYIYISFGQLVYNFIKHSVIWNLKLFKILNNTCNAFKINQCIYTNFLFIYAYHEQYKYD